MFVFFESLYDLDLTKCPKCEAHFWDKDNHGICNSCMKNTEQGKAVVRRMAASISDLLAARRYR